jgi:primosomal protein N' (replication factor Y)
MSSTVAVGSPRYGSLLVPAVAVVPLVQTRTLARPLDYLAADPLPVGAIVDAPLGPRTVRGVVVGPAEGGDRELKEVRDTGRRIAPDLVELALELAARYASTPARALELVLPPTTAPRRTPWVALAEPGEPRGAKQAAVLDALAHGPLPVTALRAATGAGADVLRRLQTRGLVEIADAPPPPAVVAAGPEPTPAQAAAIARLEHAVEARDAAPLLLFGVTGSGKTEVFLRGIERCLALGRSAIVLVPEIALAPQTAGRVSARFGPRVAVLHSALAAGERAAEHARIVRGDARIVVGPRSALFAPVADLGLIVIDEEHESAYKQDADPRYDARALAILRARHHGAAVLVATATPRPESWRTLERLELPGRIGGRLPPVDIVDLRRDGAYPISRELHGALGAIADEGGRGVLLLNRRGEAPALHCRACGVTFGCPDCDVALTLHRSPAALLCHHCGRRERIPRACPTCGAVDIARIGAGTERLEELLAETFPRLSVLRLDADSTSRRGTLEDVLERFGATDRAVLVGTQLVAKGHDFPSVRLAAAIDADVGLAQPDFRAEERTFSLLVQLAGRAGREGSGGRVLVQSWEPESRVVRLAARHAVAEFLDGELARRELLGYPPFRRIVRVLVTAPSAPAAERVLRDLADAARPHLAGDDLLGPAPLHRLRGRDRAHLLVKTERARRAAAVLGGLAGAQAAAFRRADATVVVDVDPQTL